MSKQSPFKSLHTNCSLLFSSRIWRYTIHTAPTIKTALLCDIRSNQQVAHNSVRFHAGILASRCSATYTTIETSDSQTTLKICSLQKVTVAQLTKQISAFYEASSFHYNDHMSWTPNSILKEIFEIHMFIRYTLRSILVLSSHFSTGLLRGPSGCWPKHLILCPLFPWVPYIPSTAEFLWSL